MLDAELRQPTSHLRQRTRVNFLACLGSEEIMAPAIAVEAQWKPPDGEYFRQAADRASSNNQRFAVCTYTYSGGVTCYRQC